MIKLLRFLLFPFSILYGVVMAVRNMFFSVGVFKSQSFDLPVISIGNITVGGTGKTPHTEMVISLLKDKYRLAVLSRGYGRKTKGFVEVQEDSLPEQCGDEPCQMKRKFPEQTVAVNENRREGIAQLQDFVSPDLILLDDAYQHQWVKPGLSILLVDYNRPLFKDFMMPTGEMREFSGGIRRADVVIVSKCPVDISQDTKALFKKCLRVSSMQNLFFSYFAYGEAVSVFDVKKTADLFGDVLLLTGIANPKPLVSYLGSKGANIDSCAFSDHYQFKQKDIDEVLRRFMLLDEASRIIVTTEKDAVRLKSDLDIPQIIKDNLFYVPIEVKIIGDDGVLSQIIHDYVAKN